MLRILESLEQKIHTYKISHPHLLLYIILLSVLGLCSSLVVRTLNVTAYPDLIAVYCLPGCHAAAEEMYLICCIHPKMHGAMDLGSPSSPSV